MSARWTLLLVAASVLFSSYVVAQDYTVLAPSEAKALVEQCSRRSPEQVTSFWTPSHSQVAAIESRLPALLRASGHKAELSESYRQYVGVVSNGKHLIYVNAFARFVADHPEGRTDWRSRPVTACDGGDAFWGVEFDPTDDTFNNLAFNGVA